MPEPTATVKTVPFDPDAEAKKKAAEKDANISVQPGDESNTVQMGDANAAQGKSAEELAHEAAMIKKAETGVDTNTQSELIAGKYKTQEEFDKAIVSAYRKKHGDDVEAAFKTLTGDLSSESNTNTNDSQTDEEKAAAEKAAADKAAADADTRTDAQKTADAAKELADKEADDAQAALDAQTGNEGDAGNTEDMNNFVTEYNKDGKLSDESYTKLNTAGYDRAMVDTYMAGITVQRDQLFEIVGGKENFFQMTEWASEDGGMSESDIALFNEDLNTGEPAKMQRAVNTLKTAFVTAGQKTAPGKRIEPTDVNTAGAVSGYTHIDQLKADQRDPRYKASAAFRAEVKEKIRLGKI
jgi:hypothetical protein